MFKFKKNLIKSMIKIEVVGNTPGELKLFIKQIMEIEDEYRSYERFVISAIKKLSGIQNINVDYDRGIVTINYNQNMLTVSRIQAWIDILVDITIENKDFIKDNWEKDVEQVWSTLNPILDKKVLGV